MLGLPRRFIRQGFLFVLFFVFATFLVLVANNRKDIPWNDYLPASFTPSFFQPAADSFIIDISVNGCLKFNRNSPNCGLPSASGIGSWTKLDKDLTLGKSWTRTTFLSYKKVKQELLSGKISSAAPATDTDGTAAGSAGKKGSKLEKRKAKAEEVQVIIDIAISNPKEDAKVKGNEKSKLPIAILQDFKNSKAFDDEAHEALVKEKTKEMKGDKLEIVNLDKEKSANFKIDELNAKLEEEAKAKAAEEAEIEALPDVQKRKIETSRHSLDVTYEIPSKQQLRQRGWTSKGHGIWVKYGYSSNKKAITGIDVLFGKDAVDPRPNWTLIKTGPLLDVGNVEDKAAYLSIRRGPKVDYSSKEYHPTLKLNKNGKYKILQVADLHFSTGVGVCRDPMPASTKKACEADPRTLKFLERVLDLEKPDLVVLTGDQIFGDEAPDAETAIFKALNPFISRKIPFAVTLGNHDDEGSLSREEVMALSSSLPFSFASLGPDDVAGVGNYVLTVEGPASHNPALTLYFLDTHKYSPNPKVNPGYDWLKESQLKWLESEANSRKKSIAAYTHTHMSMAFFHVPLPEYRNTGDQPLVGEAKEPPTAPRYNTNGRTVLQKIGVKVASVGHDHCNDYCLLDSELKDTSLANRIWLCYGGGSGEGGYGGWGGYVRRLRTFEIDTNSGEIKTWKRREDNPDATFDESTIVSGGEVVSP